MASSRTASRGGRGRLASAWRSAHSRAEVLGLVGYQSARLTIVGLAIGLLATAASIPVSVGIARRRHAA